MKFRYTETAVADLGNLHSYLIERNPRAAATVGKAIEATVARIAAFPASAQSTDEPALHMAPAGHGRSGDAGDAAPQNNAALILLDHAPVHKITRLGWRSRS